MRKIYLDYNATTPVHPEVIEEIKPFLTERFGNPSSIHWAGREVKKHIEEAREKVARLINADPMEIVFTSSGTEADNFAIKGTVETFKEKGDHIITTSVEHPAVLNTCKYLEKCGYRVTYLRVDSYGMLDLDELKSAITDKTILISVMFANNETGTIFPIEEIGKIAREKGVIFHCDAVQAAGKVPIDVKKLNVDLLAISGHKFYAPKGIGSLYIRRGVKLRPLIHGGHQEKNRRAGTENVIGIVALGKACEIALRDMEKESQRILGLRRRLEEGILKTIKDVSINGHPENRIPNTTNISFHYIEGESLILNLDLEGIAASTGSACTSGTLEPSHVLMAMGIDPVLAQGSVRFSLGKWNTEEDIDRVLEVLPGIVERLRRMSPLYRKNR